jgi:hypothetical protein
MSLQLSANLNQKKIGEEGHIEYSWANNIREKIVQLNFQLTRTIVDSVQFGQLKTQYKKILEELRFHKIVNDGKLTYDAETKYFVILLYKMIAYTRDIIDGKGEYSLSFMMLSEWSNIISENLAVYLLEYFVSSPDTKKSTHPYGSWKDLKYLCNYISMEGLHDSALINKSIELINNQLRIDDEKYYNCENDNISLVAKWVPREKSSKFGWIYTRLACDYFSEFMTAPEGTDSYRKAILKCKTHYRKLLSKLNKYLDTLQIKQCAHIWANIDFNNITSISLAKQKDALLNINKDGSIRNKYSGDRIECSEKFKLYIEQAKNGNVNIKGKRLSMTDFTKYALRIIENGGHNESEKILLNEQWNDNSSQIQTLTNMIAMVDVSSSMEGEPLMAAISLGIRIAEKSVLGKRIITFSSVPSWINLENCEDFVSMVKAVYQAPFFLNTNFYAALDLILSSIIENKLEPEKVQDLVLVILSDMQMDCADKNFDKTLYESIKIKYEEAGIKIWGKPYRPPHILFWNLRSTNGFPCISEQVNTSMMSGYNPSVLNGFCEKGMNGLLSSTPWYVLEKNLNNQRYKILEEKAIEVL